MKAWVARDINGQIYLYEDKPRKSVRCWVTHVAGRYFPITESDLSEGINPKWTDDEPIEVKLSIYK